MQSNYFQAINPGFKTARNRHAATDFRCKTYQHNLDYVQSLLPAQLKPRLVVKSLASIQLLKLASQKLSTQRFMVFHLPHLAEIMQTFEQADILLGKPMPIRAVESFLSKYCSA